MEIKTISPDSDFDDIDRLLPILDSKKIVALGEATHGTHEFFVYKHRMIKFLITQDLQNISGRKKSFPS